MTANDQAILTLAAIAMILTLAHLLRDPKPRAPLLAAAVICVALLPIVKRFLFT